MKEIILKTALGEIRGAELENEYEFRGVRYARAARWHAPVPVEKWDGVYDAVSGYGKKCYQYHWPEGQFYTKEFYTDPVYEVEESEDCLFMTISVPKNIEKPAEGYAVAIWYHGGGMVNGWGTEQEFDGEAFAKRGVILCRVNERLNIFGGFCHPEIVKRDGTGGNYQMLDHFAALEWVREHIGDFGGNPDKISIFGQSAGSMGVEAMLCSPRIHGKISGAIMQSGISYGLIRRLTGTVETAAEVGAKFLEKKGYTFEQFEQLPAAELYALSDEFRDFAEPYGVGYSPILDNDLLPEMYNEAVDGGKLPAISYMAGCCANDMRMDENDLENSPMYQAASNWCKTLNKQDGKNAYFYFFKRKMPGDDAGAFHSSELWYVFGTYGRCWRPLNEKDAALSERMTDAWAAFFKTGCPDTEGDWKPCTEDAFCVKEWDIEG